MVFDLLVIQFIVIEDILVGTITRARQVGLVHSLLAFEARELRKFCKAAVYCTCVYNACGAQCETKLDLPVGSLKLLPQGKRVEFRNKVFECIQHASKYLGRSS